MSDLIYTVKAEGVKDVEALTHSLESLHRVLNSGKGAGKSLEEVRRLIVGFKGQASVFEEMRNSMQSMQQSMADMSNKMPAVVRMMTRGIAQEMKVVVATMRTDGAAAGKAFTDGMSQNLDVATTVIQRQGKSIAAAARAEATKIYEAMVAGKPNAKITTKGMEALFKLQEAGATLSPYHKGILENWKKSSAETYRALQSQIDTEAKELAKLAKIGQQKIVAQVKAATIETNAPYSSLKSGRTYNMAQYMLDQIYPPKALFEAEAAKRLAEFKALQDRAARQYAAAANMPSGTYTKFNPSTGAKGATVGLQEPVIPKDKPSGVLELASAFDKLALSGNNVHSMARGLASGFNLLWLTWGNLVPLFAGAAISNGFMQTAKTGMEVAHTFETIAVLGGNTAQEMAALNAELTNLGKNGPFGPKEIAESMKTLSLAGLKANEILAVTKDVLNFSVAGTTDLKTAADALVSISTAFGMGAQGFGRVADVVSKAAAESKSSVESFANAMKTASVIHKQYGVSLEDTATSIAALSQLGIEGTAAGTALRNMYADLSGRSMQVAKVLKAQGIEMRTATGEFRPMLEVVAELNNKLLKLDGISQKNLLQAILSERGAKGMVELLQLIQQEAKNMGSGLSSALAELQRNITESYGFAAISAAKLAQTTQESFKAVKATLSTSMNEAYQAMEPTLYLLADSLKKAFSSPEFVSGLTTMVSFVANLARSFVELTKFVVEHAEVIALVSAAYIGVTALIRNKAAAMASSTAATVADTAATVANNAAKAGATGALGIMARILPGIGTAVSIAAVAWSAYDLWQNRAKDTTVEAANLYNNNVIKNLEDEAKRLAELNKLRATGLTLSEAQARMSAQATTRMGLESAEANYRQAADKATAAESLYQSKKATGRTQFQDSGGLGWKSLEDYRTAAEEARLSALAAHRIMNQTKARLESAAAKVAAEAKVEADRQLAEAEERTKRLTSSFGTGVFNLTDKNPKQPGPSARQESYTEQKALAEITKARDEELANSKRSYDLSKQLLDNRFKNELLTRTEYAIQAAAQTEAFEEKQINSLIEYNQRYQEQSLKAIAELKRNEALYLAAGNKDRAENFASLAATQSDSAIRIEKDTAEKISNIRQEAATRNQIIMQDMAGEASKLLKSDEKLWEDREDKLDAAKALEAVNQQYQFINTSVFSAAEGEKAYALAMDQTVTSVKAQNKSLEELATHLEAVADAQYAIIMSKDYSGQEDGMSQADMDRLEKLTTSREAAKKLRDRIASNTARGFVQGAEEGALAMDRVMQEKRVTLVNGVSGAIETAIFEGSDAGAASMRKLIEDELLRKPFRTVIQAGVNFLMDGAMGAVGSLFGGGGSGGSGGAGGAGGLLGTLGNASNLFGMGSKLFGGAGLGTTLSGAIGSGVGALYGTTAGNAALATSLGIDTASAVAAAKAAAEAGGVTAAVATEAAATGASIGTTLASAASILGPLTVGVMALGSLMKKQTLHTGAGAIYSAKGGLQSGGSIYNKETFGFGDSREYNATAQAFATGIAQTLATSLDGVATAFGKKAGFEVAAAFADDTSKDGAWGALKISQQGKELLNWENTRSSKWAPKVFADGEAGQAEYSAAIAKDTRQILLDMDLPGWAKKMLNDLGDSPTFEALSEVINKIAQTKSVFTRLGQTIDGFKGMTDSTFQLVLTAAGGIDQLTQSTAAFYEGFYSEAERANQASSQLAAEFAKLNVVMPTSKEAFRSMVTEALNAGQSGAALAAGLLQLAPAFMQVADAMDAARVRMQEFWASLNSSLSSLNSQIASLGGSEDDGGYQAAMDQYNADLAIYNQLTTAQEAIQDFISELSSGTLDQLGTAQLSLEQMQSRFAADLKLAMEGDAEATEKLINSSRALFEAQVKRSSTGVDARRAAAKMAISLQGLPPGVKPVEPIRPGKKDDDLTKKLLEAFKLNLEAIKNLARTIQELEMSDSLRIDLESARDQLKTTLDAIMSADISSELKLFATRINTDLANTLTGVIKLGIDDEDFVRQAAKTVESLSKGIELTVKSTLDETSMKKMLDTVKNANVAMNVVLASDVPNQIKNLANRVLEGVGSVIQKAVTTPGMSKEDILAVYGLNEDLVLTTQLVVKADKIPDDLKALVLQGATTATKTIELAIGNFKGTDKDIIFAAQADVTKRINLAVESNDANAIKLATAESNSINVLVSAYAKDGKLPDDIAKLLEGGDAQKIIDVALNVRASQFELDISSLLEARTAEIALSVGDTKQVQAALESLTAQQNITFAAVLEGGPEVAQSLKDLAVAQSVVYNAQVNAGTAATDLQALAAAQTVTFTAALDTAVAAEAKSILAADTTMTISAAVDTAVAKLAIDMLTADPGMVITPEMQTSVAERVLAELTSPTQTDVAIIADASQANAAKDEITSPATTDIKVVADISNATDLIKEAAEGPYEALIVTSQSGAAEAAAAISNAASGPFYSTIQVAWDIPPAPEAPKLTASAMGNVFYGGGVQAFASGAAFGGLPSNSIITKPLLFDMGLAGEAGPEAIMPLARDSSGSLGVKLVGGEPPTGYLTVNQPKTDSAVKALTKEVAALRASSQTVTIKAIALQAEETKQLLMDIVNYDYKVEIDVVPPIEQVNAINNLLNSIPREIVTVHIIETVSADGTGTGSIAAYEVGTNYVPADGLAYLHEGEAVVPKAYNPAAGLGPDDDTRALYMALIKKLAAVEAELQGLRSEAQSTAASSHKVAKLLDRAMPDGLSISTKVAA